jgi:DNA-binding Lrp family transcriptional regulator
MIPNYWRTVANAEGAFTHYSVQAVPYPHLPKFRKYLSRLVKEGILTRYRAFQTGDVSMNFPDFDYFNPKGGFWTFNWKQWARKVERTTAKAPIEEPKGYTVQADKTDLIIVKELELDGRKKFARIAKVVGVTLQAIKFRYDRRIIPRGLIRDHGYYFPTFPQEVSDIREVKVDFRSSSSMNNFAAAIKGVPFVYSIAKVLRQNSLILRTYLPNSEFGNMFTFFSVLAAEGRISDYSSVRLHFEGMRRQTISPELFTNEEGWQYDLEGHIRQMRRLLAGTPRAISKAS